MKIAYLLALIFLSATATSLRSTLKTLNETNTGDEGSNASGFVLPSGEEDADGFHWYGWELADGTIVLEKYNHATHEGDKWYYANSEWFKDNKVEQDNSEIYSYGMI